MIKVLLVEDQKIVLDGFRSLLTYQEKITVVGEAVDGETAIELVKNLPIDVALIDIEIPVINGLDLTKFIKENHPDIKVLILSMYQNPQYIRAAIDIGADGYMLKDRTDQEELMLAISEVYNGGIHFGQEIIKIDIEGRRGVHSTAKVNLTKREVEVLSWLNQGLTTPEIGEKLFIAHSTVDTHRKHLLKKFNVSNTILLLKKALEGGYLP